MNANLQVGLRRRGREHRRYRGRAFTLFAFADLPLSLIPVCAGLSPE